jgi:hypothetical protein
MEGYRRALTIAAAACSATACMPLEQAPLVYSSKQQIGVGVTAGTPENPGLDVNIGYKGLDAAFVPVIAGKRCPPPPSTVCPSGTYDLIKISGENGVSTSNTASDRLVQAMQSRLDAAENAIKRISVDLEAVGSDVALLGQRDNASSIVQQLEARIAAISAAAAAVPPIATDAQPLTRVEEQELAAAKGTLDRIATLDRNALETKANDLRAQLKTQTEARDDAQRELDRAIKLRNTETQDTKMDALSVYGTFSGSATGGSNGAGLTIGKSFSTGVASQNLTQGIRDSAIAGAKPGAVTACIKQAETTVKASDLTATQKNELMAALLRKCSE